MLNWKKAIITDNKASIPNNWLYLHYYEALVTLFRIENAMRIFVYSVLKSEFKNDWTKKNVYDTTKTICSIAEERNSRDSKLGYIGYTISCPIMHLMLGELIYLIFKHWPIFETYFPGERKIMEYKLNEIASVRNSIAHFRPIQADDVELIKQNSKHVLIKIDDYITDMLRCNKTIPSNTSENWYLKFTKLNSFCKKEGLEYCSLKVLEDKNHKWVAIELDYNCQVIKLYNYSGEHKFYTITNLNSSDTIKLIPRVVKSATYITEDTTSYSSLVGDGNKGLNCPYTKTMKFTFRRETMELEYDKIFHDFYKIVRQILVETDMILLDKDARGSFIHSLEIIISQDKTVEDKITWSMGDEKLLTNVQPNDPPEFWGPFDSINNFITNAHNYPWMGVDISNKSNWNE